MAIPYGKVGRWELQHPIPRAELREVRVVGILKDPSEPRMVYEPGHPDADKNGYVAYPNVNVAEEMINLIAATRAYDANVSVIQALKSMISRAIQIGRAT
jgi:flagellar basal-body rod protein FlgC